jgi:HlyD family secretion protein
MKSKKIVWALILIPVAYAIYWGTNQYATGSNSLPPLHTVQADHGDVSQRVVAHGSLQPVQKVTVGSQVSGILNEIYVDFNSRVQKGQVIAQIDPSTFAAAASSAQAELEAAEAALNLAKVQHERVQELRANQFVSASEVDEVTATMQQAEAQLAVRRHALERARRELERCTITSPTDGIVISRNVDVGQTVAASLSAPDLFEIATDLSRMYIHANVSEADIGTIREDQNVIFRVDAHRNRDFNGAVIQVRNAPIIMDNVVHYETIIAVNNEEGLLKPGMTAEVSIITAEVKDALRVRNTALRARLPDSIRPEESAGPNGDDSGRVFLLRNGEITSKQVQTGLSDGLYTEIINGISTGDTLVVGLSLRSTDDSGSRNLLRGNQAQY